jgi:biotin operon repressor
VDGPPVSCRPAVDSTPAALRPLALPAASLTDQTLAAIRQATRSSALQPEQPYSAYQIAAMLGVSRSPVREALMRLVEADMIKLERNRGFRVEIPGRPRLMNAMLWRCLLLMNWLTHSGRAFPGRVAAVPQGEAAGLVVADSGGGFPLAGELQAAGDLVEVAWLGP